MSARKRLLLATVAVTLVVASCGALSTPGSTVPASSASPPPGTLGEQRSDDASITVAVSWLSGAALLVTMDTHSVDLDGFDLQALARLRLDQGSWVTPSGWDAPKGGHHRVGTLTFVSLDTVSVEKARVIELELRDIGVPLRTLRWARP